jgi:hypothetical protein
MPYDLVGSVEVELPSQGATGERCMYQLDSGGTLECTIDNVEAEEEAHGQEDVAEAQLLAAMREKSKARGAVIIADAATAFTEADEAFVPEVTKKTDDVIATIGRAISDHFLFVDLESDEMEGVVGAFSQRTCKQGEEIIQQGITGEDQSMYVVGDGSFDVFVDEQKVATLGPGEASSTILLLLLLLLLLVSPPMSRPSPTTNVRPSPTTNVHPSLTTNVRPSLTTTRPLLRRALSRPQLPPQCHRDVILGRRIDIVVPRP